MASVTFEQVTRVYPGQDIPAVDRLDLHVAHGELLVLTGPVGSGASTTLRLLAGLEEVTSGRLLLDEQDITDRSAPERDVAMVLQTYALYPNLTVGENLGFALRVAGIDDAEITRRVREAAELLELGPLLDRTPPALTRELRHRVAMGRAIVRAPQVFLMDDPLATLEAPARAETRQQLAELQRRIGVTTIYVTHDPEEAVAMGGRIAVLDEGRLVRCGTAEELRTDAGGVALPGFLPG